ncbi:MAG: FixH family protein [Bacteroidales bacterium]|nr:FixH family protein [Bacteroidales bacterium]
MNAIRTTLLLISLTFVLASCNDNDDVIDDFGQEILITDDVDCCSVDEARQVYEFIRKQKEITSLTQDIDDKYRLRVFSPTGSLHTGYNDLYFVVTKIVSANYVKDIEIKSFTPIMSMSSGMEHSTPFSGSIDNFDNGLLAIRHGWVSFVMNTSDNGSWNLDFDIRILKAEEHFSLPIQVDALADGQKWISQFKVGEEAYHISLVNPTDWKVGTNDISAQVTAVAADKKTPYLPADKKFTIDITPSMPDMGYHSAPEGTPLTPDADGLYNGVVNFTMTGLWRLHLTVRDENGIVVAGGDDTDHGFSSLSLEVTL